MDTRLRVHKHRHVPQLEIWVLIFGLSFNRMHAGLETERLTQASRFTENVRKTIYRKESLVSPSHTFFYRKQITQLPSYTEEKHVLLKLCDAITTKGIWNFREGNKPFTSSSRHMALFEPAIPRFWFLLDQTLISETWSAFTRFASESLLVLPKFWHCLNTLEKIICRSGFEKLFATKFQIVKFRSQNIMCW